MEILHEKRWKEFNILIVLFSLQGENCIFLNFEWPFHEIRVLQCGFFTL